MTRGFAVLAATAVATGLVAMPVSAQSSGAGQIIRFREVDKGSRFKFVDLPPLTKVGKRGPNFLSAGDVFILETPLADESGRIGQLRAVCTATRSTRKAETANVICTGAFVLRKGSLFVAVAGSAAKITKGAVTGGTGAYAGVHGSFTSEPTNTGANDAVTLLP